MLALRRLKSNNMRSSSFCCTSPSSPRQYKEADGLRSGMLGPIWSPSGQECCSSASLVICIGPSICMKLLHEVEAIAEVKPTLAGRTVREGSKEFAAEKCQWSPDSATRRRRPVGDKGSGRVAGTGSAAIGAKSEELKRSSSRADRRRETCDCKHPKMLQGIQKANFQTAILGPCALATLVGVHHHNWMRLVCLVVGDGS